ncbi:MAG: SagB/ThcOx family dehydrogenase [Clostridiales bacterium]|nr:SagB/ThcOx family dehydrogenase [Clostridiales bacterium]
MFRRIFLLGLLLVFSACVGEVSAEGPVYVEGAREFYYLPPPAADGRVSVERALMERRSRRDFRDMAISQEQLSQILWAAYGITLPMPDSPRFRGGFRTTPSAGATFPLEIYAIIGNVNGIAPGIFRYISEEHKLERLAEGDFRSELSEAAWNQNWLRDAPATIAHIAVFTRTTGVYGERGIRYVYIELGHSAQNIYLQAEALGLGTVAVGAFNDNAVRHVLNLPEGEDPLYLMPIGYFYE